MELNKIHHLDNREGLAQLPEKCASLIIADPPYFEVKGDFDFVWSSFAEYLEFMEGQARLYKRILAQNGTLFVYGHAKRIAYVQVIFDRLFNLENNITVHIFDRQTNKGVEAFRCFAPVTERLLMYSNETEETGLQMIMNDRDLFKSIRDYFQLEREKCPLSYKEINERCFGTASNGGGMASNILTPYKEGWSFPTKEKYEALQSIGICARPYEALRLEYEALRLEYEALRLEYEALRRPFNNLTKLTDVMAFSQESHITRKYLHDTVKPEKLSKSLILTCSKPGDLVVVPFAGSGTECAMAAAEQRQFIGFETTLRHVDMSNQRVYEATRQDVLFSC